MSVLSGASTGGRAAEHLSNDAPFYLAIGEECTLFEMAFRERLPLLLKGHFRGSRRSSAGLIRNARD